MYSAYSSRTNISRYNQIVYFEKYLTVETYIIGYKNEGEAILFVVRADGGISFSGLVDCFRLEDIDKVRDVLKENEIQNLDFICWTHPDFDHSKGLKNIIDTHATEKTYIWIPEGVETQEITCSKEVKELFAYLKECSINASSDLNVYSVSDKKDLMYYNSLCFQKGINGFPLEIVSYAPNSKIIRKKTYMDKFIKNDRSIFFVLAIGDVRIFLTGDIEDDTIEKLPRDILGGHVHIMKIPHHGSDSSLKMFDLGWYDCDIACSTVYRKGNTNLPLKNVMRQYEETTKYLFCTGNADKDCEKEKYGIVKIVTNVLDNSFSTYTEGNAGIWGA